MVDTASTGNPVLIAAFVEHAGMFACYRKIELPAVLQQLIQKQQPKMVEVTQGNHVIFHRLLLKSTNPLRIVKIDRHSVLLFVRFGQQTLRAMPVFFYFIAAVSG